MVLTIAAPLYGACAGWLSVRKARPLRFWADHPWYVFWLSFPFVLFGALLLPSGFSIVGLTLIGLSGVFALLSAIQGIVPLDEPLLQTEVIDKLVPRLFEKFPERAKELVGAYHVLVSGKDCDSIFAEAFKTLEQLARDITLDSGFVFDKSHLDKHFPLLHPTIHQTLVRLGGHRGDKAGHGKDAPPLHEIRYLLFAVCNSALLLLDYPGN